MPVLVRRRRPFAGRFGRDLRWLRYRASFLICCGLFYFSTEHAQAQLPQPPVDVIARPAAETGDRIVLRDGANKKVTEPKPPEDDSCLLAPLNLMKSPVVEAARLQVPPKARKEYQDACAALKDKKVENAEKHLRKAVREYPKYSAAWVTLGQMMAAEQKNEEARSSCAQATSVDPTYVPGYLCLADIAL